MAKDGFILGRIKSIKFALRGIKYLVSTEHSIMVQVAIAVIMCIIGFIVGLNSIEWLFQFLAIGLVLVAESLNTAIEKLADFVHPTFDKKIGFVKDISAGGVAIAAIIAVIIGLIIYIPKFS